MIRIKKKGFSMIELLAAIVILGILTTIAVVAVTNYIGKSKAEIDKQNEQTIVEAAKAYLNVNTDEKPKTIGESKKITLKTLKENKYLKEDIKNSKDESCMKNSYVYVYKNGYTSYSYKGILYCGNDKIKPDKEIPKPTVTDFMFSDMNNVKSSSFSMKLHGSSDDSIGIESYNYTISIINQNDGNKNKMYNSGAIDGKRHKVINLKNIVIKDYIDITGYTSVKVSVVVRNTLGGMTEYTETSYFEDTKAPKCEKIEGEANIDEWFNKNDIANNVKRQISVTCNDEQGSGCIRNKFSKTWPDKDNKSVEYSTITITDNSKNNNSTDCRVRVNVDLIAPTITVSLANNPSNVPLVKVASDGVSNTIENSDYQKLHNGWINYNNYPEGLQFNVNVTDDINLYKYIWETGGLESKEEYINLNENNTKSSSFYINLIDDGARVGKLTVFDRAGNTTEFYIKANIDRSAPNNPTVKGYKKTNSNDISNSTGLSEYNFDWYNGYVLTEASGSTDAVSGLDGYYCTSKGQAEDITNKKQSIRNVNKQGEADIIYKACDNAGNCSSDVKRTVKLDRAGPNISCEIDSNKGTIKNIKITTITPEYYFKNCNNVTSDKSKCKTTSSYETMVTSKAKNKEDIAASWGDVSIPNTCGNTYYGYVRAKSKSGAENIQKCTGSYKTKNCCSEGNLSECEWTTTCRSGKTHLYFGDKTGPEFIDAGYARHGDKEDRLYIIKDSKSYTSDSGTKWIRVCALSFQINEWDYDDYYKPLEEKIVVDGVTRKCHKVWVAENCTGIYYNQLNQECTNDAPRTCPG